jgi:hypothetical protein
MATITVTNQKASQALFGQSVTVTLDSSDSLQLAHIAVGDKIELDSSGNIGYICSIDLYGNSFKANPVDGASTLASTTPVGYLAEDEDIDITTT